jgi:tetraacyldisaccharide-1-P 4'-kinase
MFTDRDVARIAAAARAAGATVVMTTEKDAVRFEAVPIDGVPIAAVPLTVAIEPAADFSRWIGSRLDAARQTHPPDRRRQSAPAVPQRSSIQ